MKLLALLVILCACFFDPIRDVWMTDGVTGWWPRHLVKWAAFYPPLLFVVLSAWWPVHRYGITPVREFLLQIALIAIAAQLTWWAGLWVAGWPWSPMLFRWLQ